MVVCRGVSKGSSPIKVDVQADQELVTGLADNHLPRRHVYKWRCSPLGAAIHNVSTWAVGCECQSSAYIHDEIHPKELRSCKDGLLRATG